MDSLQDILGQKKFIAPDEITAVKTYIFRRYKSGCRVKTERDNLVLTVRGSALAATIRLEQNQLIAACGLKKRLVIRIGG
jgi:hypothetical protein